MTRSPTSLRFASRPLGTTSAAQTVTLTNSGAGTTYLGTIAVSGNFAYPPPAGMWWEPIYKSHSDVIVNGSNRCIAESLGRIGPTHNEWPLP